MTTKTAAPEAINLGTVTGGGSFDSPWTGTRYDIGGYHVVAVNGGKVREECTRCDESGFIAAFAGIYNGECFECHGLGLGRPFAGGLEEAREVVRKRLMDRAARERKAQREADAKAAAAADWAAANPELAARLAAYRAEVDTETNTESGPLYEIAFAAKRQPLSEKQAAFVTVLLEERADRFAAEAAEQAAKASRVHVGTEGEKVTVEVTVAAVIACIDRRSYVAGATKPLVKMLDADGNVVKWFASSWSAKPEVMVAGAKLTITAAVKEHGEYDGQAETTVIRVKVAA